MLATVLMTLSGTPFIYQGQEFGTTSAQMTDLGDYRDVETFRSYKTMSKVFGKKKAMKLMAYCSRDNARTPMQWDDSPNAGFTTAQQPWIKVNPNYVSINAAQAQKDENSVLHYYKKLIAMRKQDKAFVYGTYTDMLPKDRNVMAYLRESQYGTLAVAANFANKTVTVKLPPLKDYKAILCNYVSAPQLSQKLTLRPYEAVIYKKQ